MTSPTLPPTLSAQINWSKVATVFAMATALAGTVAAYGRLDQKVLVIEDRTRPLANGDLVRVQQDVAWIRSRLEREDRG